MTPQRYRGDGARRRGVQGIQALLPAGIAQIDAAFARESLVRARVASGGDAIEKVDAALHGVEKVKWGADTHEVARPVHGQKRRTRIDSRAHEVAVFAYADSAYRVADEVVFEHGPDRRLT